MAMLTSAFAYLGSYYHEANPSLQGTLLYPVPCLDADTRQGQNIYTKRNEDSFTLMNKQIYRLIGKATTMAAYVQAA
jgi:citrate synthase